MYVEETVVAKISSTSTERDEAHLYLTNSPLSIAFLFQHYTRAGLDPQLIHYLN